MKLAALLLHGCELQKAIAALDRSGGQLRAALALAGKSPEIPDFDEDHLASETDQLALKP